jgi:hypothetical protein
VVCLLSPQRLQGSRSGDSAALVSAEVVHQPSNDLPRLVPLQVFTLSRTVRTFGTERREGARYSSWLKRLTHLSVRQAAAYLMYLTTNSGLYYLTKARAAPCCWWILLQQRPAHHGHGTVCNHGPPAQRDTR